MQTDWFFPPFHLDVRGERLWRGTQLLELRPKTFAILRYLVEHAGELITKAQLLDAMWPGIAVGDAVLKVSIGELREVLGDLSHKPRFIETVHRRGYRFIGQVTDSQPSGVSAKEAATSGKPQTSPLSQPTSNPPPLTSSIVGRDAELTRLHNLFEKTLHGERQFVFVAGDAGIGKTALVDTFLAQVMAYSTVWSVRGQCFAHYGTSEAYLPILEAMSVLCRGPARERIIALLQQYAPTWLAQLPTVLSAAEREALYRRRLGSSQERMLRELADFLEVLGTQAPVIFILEDLHWSDTSTLDLVSVLARRATEARLLVLSTYRPVELILHKHPLKQVKQELEGHNKCVEVALELLPVEAVSQFVKNRLAENQYTPQGVDDLAAFIHSRTDGHPLFMTALVDEAVNRYVTSQTPDGETLRGTLAALDQRVPENIRHLIERQKEQLEEDAQQVLEVASVVGTEFSAATVAAALEKEQEWVEECCDQLAQQRQFLQPVGLVEWPDGTVAGRYAFLHALHQNVLYEGLTPVRQLTLHRRVGEREEAAYGDRASEIAAVLAHRFDCGKEYRRAVRYLQLSATAAKGRAAPREGIQNLTKALQLLQMWPEGGERLGQELLLQLALGPMLMATRGYASVEVEHAFARAQELCQQLGNPPLLFPAIWGVWASHLVRGNIYAARELAEQVFALAQQTQDPDQLVEAHHALWVTKFFAGEFESVLSHVEQGLSLYRPIHQEFIGLYGQDAATVGLSYRAVTSCLCGYYDQAVHASEQALAQAHDVAHLFSVGFAMQFATWTSFFRGDSTTLLEQADAQIAFSIEQGFPFWLAGGVHFRSHALAAQGRVEEGLKLIRQGLTAWQATGAKLAIPSYLATFAELYIRTQRLEEASSVLEQAFAFMEQTGQRYYEAELWRLKGDILLMQDVQSPKSNVKGPESAKTKSKPLTPNALAEAEECFLNAIEVAQRQRAKTLELRALMSLVRLRQHPAAKHGQHPALADAHKMLSEVYNWFTEGFDAQDLQEAKTLLSELSGGAAPPSRQQKPTPTKRAKKNATPLEKR